MKTDISQKNASESTIKSLAEIVLANPRLAWIVVSAWLEQHGYVLVNEDDEYKRLAKLLPNLPVLETYEKIKQAQ